MRATVDQIRGMAQAWPRLPRNPTLEDLILAFAARIDTDGPHPLAKTRGDRGPDDEDDEPPADVAQGDLFPGVPA